MEEDMRYYLAITWAFPCLGSFTRSPSRVCMTGRTPLQREHWQTVLCILGKVRA